MAIDYFAGLQLPLQVGRDEVPTAHAHAAACSDGCEGAEGSWSHCGAKRLVVIHTVRLGTALHA
eukprot:293949-Pleurochrysis_carterae.AAC.2